MTPKEKAKYLVNDQYYQPLTIHLNLTNNSREMWDYAKRCALICVGEIIKCYTEDRIDNAVEYWTEVKSEINNL